MKRMHRCRIYSNCNGKKRQILPYIAMFMICIFLIAVSVYKIPVSAEDTTDPVIPDSAITGTIDYTNEVIIVSSEDDGEVLFYAVGKDVEKASGSKAKWYPLIGETIDISKTIPKKSNTKVYIGLKSSSGAVKTIEIVGRPDTKSLKTEAKTLYNGTNAFVNESGSYDIELKIGLSCDWIIISKTSKSDEIYYPDMFPIGAAGVVRIAASENSFASAEVKFKISAMPKSPNGSKIGFSKKKDISFIKGLTDKMEVLRKAEWNISEIFSVSEEDYGNFWLSIKEKNMGVVDFVKALTGDNSIDSSNYADVLEAFLKDDNYVFSLRFKSTDKKSASAITTFEISKADMATAFSVKLEADSTISLIYIESPVGIGQSSSVVVKGLPETEYSIVINYSSGGGAQGLDSKTSNKDGMVSWSWVVGTNTTPGEHSLTISGGNSSLEVKFVVNSN